MRWLERIGYIRRVEHERIVKKQYAKGYDEGFSMGVKHLRSGHDDIDRALHEATYHNIFRKETA